MADAAADAARGLRHRDRRAAFRARVRRACGRRARHVAALARRGPRRARRRRGDGPHGRARRSALLPADRGRYAARRRVEGAAAARLGAGDRLRGARPRDGRVGLGGSRSAMRSSSAKASRPTSITNEQGRRRSSSPAHAASSAPRSAARSRRAASRACWRRAAASSTCATAPPSSGSSPQSGPSTCSWPPPRSAASPRTTATRPISFATTCRSRPTSSTPRTAHGTRKLCFLGSSCIYPRLAPQPMQRVLAADGAARADERVVRDREDRRHQDVPGLRPAARVQCDLRDADEPLRPRRQLRPADLARPARAAAQVPRRERERPKDVTVWGTGTPRREFLHVDDLADALLLPDGALRLARDHQRRLRRGRDDRRAGGARSPSIVGFRGAVVFDRSKPDGTPRKLLDVGKIKALGWQARTRLPDGIRATYDWYLASPEQARVG